MEMQKQRTISYLKYIYIYHQTSSNRRMSTMFLFIDFLPHGILCMIQNPLSLENP